jgi:hypothetical protein
MTLEEMITKIPKCPPKATLNALHDLDWTVTGAPSLEDAVEEVLHDLGQLVKAGTSHTVQGASSLSWRERVEEGKDRLTIAVEFFLEEPGVL